MTILNFLSYIQKSAEFAYNNEHNPLDDMRNSGLNVHFEYYTKSSDFFLTENTSTIISEELMINAADTIFVLLDNSDQNNKKVIVFSAGWRIDSNGFQPTKLHK